MKRENLYKVENLIFASKHNGITGSLYFRAVENGKIYRGRIRLCHEDGPYISKVEERKEEKYWKLGNNAWYNNISQSGVCYGDIVANEDQTLENAKGKTIFEKYTNGEHPSRGCLVPRDEYQDVTQDILNKIIWIIENYSPKQADKALIELADMPPSLRQIEAFYGC